MSEIQWEMVTDGEYMPRPGVDQLRSRYVDENGEWTDWCEWCDIRTRRSINGWRDQSALRDWQFRRPRQQPTAPQPQPPEPEHPALSAGSKYKRMLRQTLPEGHAGAFAVVDVYDVLRAWDVHCPAIQHAIKKLLQPGQRGSKSAAQDLREAIGSIERAIQLLGDG